MASTNRQTLKQLSTSILNKLENRKYIEIASANRGELQENVTQYLSRSVITDEDLVERVRKDIMAHSDTIQDQNLTETSAFQSRKKALREQLGEHEIHGFYFQKPVRSVVQDLGRYLFDTDLVDEVYESDEAIHKLVIETIQNFDPSKIS